MRNEIAKKRLPDSPMQKLDAPISESLGEMMDTHEMTLRVDAERMREERVAKNYTERFRNLFKNDTHTEFSREAGVLRKAIGNSYYPKTILAENHGFVLCVEGPDGAGKSALVNELADLYLPKLPKRRCPIDTGSSNSDQDVPEARGSLVCNTYRHPNDNTKISPTGCTVRKWLSNGNALGASMKDEMSAPLFQSAMMESWEELQEYLSKVTALRIVSEGQPHLAEDRGFGYGLSDLPADSVTTPFTLIDRSPISCIVYGTLSGIHANRMYRFMNNGTLNSNAMLILAPSIETVRKRIVARKDGDASLARMEEEKPGYLEAVCAAYRYLRDKQIGYISNIKAAADRGLISPDAHRFLQTMDVIPGYIETQGDTEGKNGIIPYLYKIPSMLSAITGEASIDTTAMQTLLLADMYMTINYDLNTSLKYRTTKPELTKTHKFEKQKSIDLLTVPYIVFLQWMQEWVLTWPGRYDNRSYKWFKEVTDAVRMW